MGTNTEPLVSVIIPTYNRASMITRTIENIFAQTYRNKELIIIDDGSTDDTQARLNAFGDRIRVITQSNAGPAIARNRGAEAARGSIIAFQDSDDLWKPTKLARQVALLAKYPSAPCCLCNTVLRIIGGKEWTSFDDSVIHPQHTEGLWLNVAEVLATRFVLFNQAAAIRRTAFEKVGGFRNDLKYLEDYDLPLRLSLEPWTFIREPLIMYGDCSPESFSQQALRDSVVLRQCAVTILESILARVSVDATDRVHLRMLLRQRLRMSRCLLVAARLEHSDRLGGLLAARALIGLDRYLRAAFRRSPWFPHPITTQYS